VVPPSRPTSAISNDISGRNRRRTTKQKIGCFYFSSAQSKIIFWGACLIITCCTIEQIFVSISIVHLKIDTTYRPPPPPPFTNGIAPADATTNDYSEETLIRRRWNYLPPNIRVPRNKTQQCANALLDRSTHRLIPTKNKECPSSIDLSKTKKMIQRREREPGPLLTFLLIYYNDDQNFAHQLDSWMKFSYEALSRIRFIVVDDGSDVGHRAVEMLGSNLANSTTSSSSSNNNNNINKNIGLSSLDIRVYEIDQDIDWNIGGGRNLGFWIASQVASTNTDTDTDNYSSSSWVFMNDADILIPPETMDFVLGLTEKLSDDKIDVNVDVHDDNDGFELNTANKRYHSSEKRNTTTSEKRNTTTNKNNYVYGFFQRIGKKGNLKKKSPHPAVMLSTTDSYWTAGGCDEDFVGNYGYTDPHFFYRVEKHHSLKVINTHERMDLVSIPPLIEMSNKHKIFKSCPESIYCKPKQKHSVRSKVNNNDNNNENSKDNYDGEKKNKPSLSKDTTINKELYVQKTISGNWSIDYLRFTWRRVW
jgi:hypothetical protein